MFNIILPALRLRFERWKWNKEFRIYVSTYGNFKDEHKNPIPVKISDDGYVVIKTSYGFKLAHRLVLKTWRSCANEEDLTVDHLNHNKRDNSLYNLEWVTPEENRQRAMQDMVVLKDGELVEYLVVKQRAREKQLGQTAPKGRYICAGATHKHKFTSCDEAAKWITDVRKMNHCGDKPKVSRIADRVRIAAETNSMYCGYRWSYSN